MSSADSVEGSIGAGAPRKIGITPEMIRAGVEAFAGYDQRYDPPEIAVEEIFTAMYAASFFKVAAAEDSAAKMLNVPHHHS